MLRFLIPLLTLVCVVAPGVSAADAIVIPPPAGQPRYTEQYVVYRAEPRLFFGYYWVTDYTTDSHADALSHVQNSHPGTELKDCMSRATYNAMSICRYLIEDDSVQAMKRGVQTTAPGGSGCQPACQPACPQKCERPKLFSRLRCR